MAHTGEKKVYGLILPKKVAAKTGPKKPSIFDDESDDEEIPIPGKKPVQISKKSSLKTQTQLEIEKALQDDPTVYEYDSLYDDMQQKKIEKTAPLLGSKDNKPRYIANLLKAAELRKKEDERRKERTVQKEREEEEKKGQFQDKEKFVTSAYKKKLLEIEKEAEEEKRKAALEDAMDVTKQRDLSGFYRHLLNQSTGEERIPQNTDVKQEAVEKPEIKREVTTVHPDDRDDSMSSSSDSDSGDSDESNSDKKTERPIKDIPKLGTRAPLKTGRHYRQRDADDDNVELQPSQKRSPHHHSKHRRSQSKSPIRKRSRRSRSRERWQSRSHDRSRRSTSHERQSSHLERSGEKSRRPRGDRSRSREDKRRTDRHLNRERSRSRSRSRDGRRAGDREKGRKDQDREKTDSRHKHKDSKVDSGSRDNNKTSKSSAVKGERPISGAKAAIASTAETPSAKGQSLAERFAKRNVGSALEAARARYLARQRARHVIVEAEED